MTEVELEEIEARAKAAIEGPWRWAGPCLNAYASNEEGKRARFPAEILAHADDEAGTPSPADAEFIAHARTDVPALVAEIKRLHKLLKLADEVAKLRDVLERANALEGTRP